MYFCKGQSGQDRIRQEEKTWHHIDTVRKHRPRFYWRLSRIRDALAAAAAAVASQPLALAGFASKTPLWLHPHHVRRASDHLFLTCGASRTGRTQHQSASTSGFAPKPKPNLSGGPPSPVARLFSARFRLMMLAERSLIVAGAGIFSLPNGAGGAPDRPSLALTWFAFLAWQKGR
ncbi:hypothetical protein TARUN_1201 [Trichoderma arundinaceum]|uniref:Uncharacterized protein n=1 Tax=Trichoderma arundinaceum TaxID=490622 RepID=A0A395NY61_TRIAR|nr:hypothetical protein TARUN_1201 [Trichoderma arundinaceum]